MSVFKSIDKKGYMLIFISIIFVVGQVWLELKSPEYMQRITLLVTSPGGEMSEILRSGAKMLFCCLGSLLSSIVVAVFAARISSDFSTDLRQRFYDKVQSFSMKEIGYFSTASLLTRATNDTRQVRMLIVMGLQVMIKAPIMAVWAIIKIANQNAQWTKATVVAIFVLLVVVTVCVSIVMPKFKRLQTLTDDLNRVTRENLTGIRVVRAYNAENYQESKFEAINTDFTKTNLFASNTMAFLMPCIQLVMNGSSLAIYWIGAYLIDNAAMADKLNLFAEMSVFSQYSIQVIMSFMMLVMIFIILPRAIVSIKRINEVLTTESSIVEGKLDVGETELKGKVEFCHVSFRYPDGESDVLHDISFTANKGETVAIIGATGCGKSTLTNLISRFYDVSEGKVLVDGINVKDYTERSLRNRIAHVTQQAILFSGSIRSNVQYGDNGKGFSKNAVEDALSIAQATEFVDKLPDGADSHVAQGGTNFSGGQKQRISIARAVARNAEIMIFDDSFSALDYATDRKLRIMLKEKCKAATKIIVAQRIGTIRDADKILVLDEGRIVGMGTHKELMQNCEEYQQIAYSQLSKEEAL